MRKKPRPEGRGEWGEWGEWGERGERGVIFFTDFDNMISLCFDIILLQSSVLIIEIRFEKKQNAIFYFKNRNYKPRWRSVHKPGQQAT